MRSGIEISWILDGRSPEQIPLARLAEYMQQFAALLGDDKDVHFARIEEGSTRLVAKLAPGKPAQRAQARVYAVRDRRAAPAEATRAARRINEMVSQDHTQARITFGAGAILRFSGKVAEQDRAVTLTDTATITGRLYALVETPTGLNARIRPRNAAAYIACTADAEVGRELRNFFMEAVRVQGHGKWTRSVGGEWACESVHIKKVDGVSDVSLRDAINTLRATQVVWPEDPLADWDALQENGSAA